MNSRVQGKINEIRKLSTRAKGGHAVSVGTNKQSTDGLSMAIHSERDADTFIMELKAIRKRSR